MLTEDYAAATTGPLVATLSHISYFTERTLDAKLNKKCKVLFLFLKSNSKKATFYIGGKTFRKGQL